MNRSLEQMDCVILEEVSGENITDSNPFSAFGNQTITDKKKDIKLDNNQLLDFLANNNLLFSKKGYKSVISGNRYRKLFSDRCIIKNTSSGTTTTTLTSIDKDACENSPYSGNWHSYEPTISVVEVGQAVDDNSNISPFSNIVINDSDDDEVIVKVTLDNVDGGSFSELSGFTDKLDGTFTLDTTSDSHAQASLRGMVFTPDENQLPAGSIDISRLTIHLNESLPNDDTSDDTTTIITTSVNDVPIISGAVSGQVVNDNSSISPFSEVTISDVDDSASVSLTIMLDVQAKGSFTTLSEFLDNEDGSPNPRPKKTKPR